MFKRCYSKVDSANNSSYANCHIVDEWHSCTKFNNWFEENKQWYKEGFALDRDLLCGEQKVYGPNNCCFLPRSLNLALSKIESGRKSNNIFGVGVNFTKSGKFKARFDSKTLGVYTNAEEAVYVYKKYRADRMSSLLLKHKDEISPIAVLAFSKLEEIQYTENKWWLTTVEEMIEGGELK